MNSKKQLKRQAKRRAKQIREAEKAVTELNASWRRFNKLLLTESQAYP